MANKKKESEAIHGEEFYSEIGTKNRVGGGQRVRKLIEEGKAHEEE